MENIKDSFHVATPLEQTWSTLLDIERIAPCMPGAQLQEVEGDEYRGVVKIKVGPIQAQYKGAARLALVDPATRTIKIDASGRDTRGQGNASAMITVTMVGDASGTTVDIDTEVNVTGKVAQFGRGEMSKISAKLLRQFVDSLERDILNAPAPAPGMPAAPEAAPTSASPTSASPTSSHGMRRIDGPEAAPIDLLETAGGSIAKLVLPLAGVALVLFLLFRRRKT
jgi:carbon monoxide dehydrogenase subunit G